MSLAVKIDHLYQGYFKRMAWIYFLSLFLMVNATGLASQYSWSLFIVLLVLILLPFVLLSIQYVHLKTNPIVFFARRLRLTAVQKQELQLTFGLLASTADKGNEFETNLRDRALTPWLEPLTRACRLGWLTKSMVSFQLLLVISLVIIHAAHSTTPHLITKPQLVANEMVLSSIDTQNEPNQTDAIAEQLLSMRQMLVAFSDVSADAAMQNLLEQLNDHWQRVESLMDDGDQSTMLTRSSLQSASHLPLSGLRSLQSKVSRQALTDALDQDIQTLARMGVRFDGPGMTSHGKAIPLEMPAANPAEGRYHEYIASDEQANAGEMSRRLEQVPPRYRQTVARYLVQRELIGNAKASKGVEP